MEKLHKSEGCGQFRVRFSFKLKHEDFQFEKLGPAQNHIEIVHEARTKPGVILPLWEQALVFNQSLRCLASSGSPDAALCWSRIGHSCWGHDQDRRAAQGGL